MVEDDEILRETIGEVMADDGHEIRLARNGHEALDHLSAWEADVIILDLMMPGMDAFEFRAEQARRGAGLKAQVLVLSAIPDLAGAAEQLEADAFLSKPFVLDEMIAVIGDLVERRAS